MVGQSKYMVIKYLLVSAWRDSNLTHVQQFALVRSDLVSPRLRQTARPVPCMTLKKSKICSSICVLLHLCMGLQDHFHVML